MVFFNDLLFSLESDVDNYADDTTITSTAKSVDEIGNKLTSDCKKISDWMKSNLLKLNPDKTHVMTLGTAERLRTLTSKVKVTMDDVQLEESPQQAELLLGCHIQANLKWNTQVEMLLSKLRKRITGLMKIRFVGTFNLRKTITEGIFNSVLVYCLPLFGGMGVGFVRQLQIMQNKAARIVTSMPPVASRSSMFEKLKWLSINQLVFYHSVILVYKIRKSNEPEHLASILGADSRNNRIIIPNMDLRVAQESFTIRAANYWNLLPHTIRTQSKISQFKKHAKSWILEKVDQFLD